MVRMNRFVTNRRSHRRPYLSTRMVRKKFAALRAALGCPPREEHWRQSEFAFGEPGARFAEF